MSVYLTYQNNMQSDLQGGPKSKLPVFNNFVY